MSQEEKNINLPDSEVLSRPQRRRYSAEYKLRILKEYDACEQPGMAGNNPEDSLFKGMLRDEH